MSSFFAIWLLNRSVPAPFDLWAGNDSTAEHHTEFTVR